jgi:hypothetical protein
MENDKFPKLVCKYRQARYIDDCEFGTDTSLSCEEEKRKKKEEKKIINCHRNIGQIETFT